MSQGRQERFSASSNSRQSWLYIRQCIPLGLSGNLLREGLPA